MTKDDQRAIEICDIDNMLSSRASRDFLNRLLDSTGVFADGYNKCPYHHALNAGRRRVGLWLVNELQHAPDKYYQMIKEREDMTR